MRKQTTLERVYVWLETYDIDINYGLCPNPFGFTFIDNDDVMSIIEKNHLSLLLDELSMKESMELREGG